MKRFAELMENLPSCPCEDVRGSVLSLKERLIQYHVGRSEEIFHFSYIFLRWFHLCDLVGKSSSSLYHTILPIIIIIILHLCKLGAPGRTPVRSRSSSTQSDPAGRKEFSPVLNGHLWPLTFEIIRLSKSILSMKSLWKARCMDGCVAISQKSRIMSAGSRKAPCSSSPTAVGPSGSSCLLLKCVKDLRVLFLLLLCKFLGPLLSLARAVATKKIQLQISKNRLSEFFG